VHPEDIVSIVYEKIDIHGEGKGYLIVKPGHMSWWLIISYQCLCLEVNSLGLNVLTWDHFKIITPYCYRRIENAEGYVLIAVYLFIYIFVCVFLA